MERRGAGPRGVSRAWLSLPRTLTDGGGGGATQGAEGRVLPILWSSSSCPAIGGGAFPGRGLHLRLHPSESCSGLCSSVA